MRYAIYSNNMDIVRYLHDNTPEENPYPNIIDNCFEGYNKLSPEERQVRDQMIQFFMIMVIHGMNLPWRTQFAKIHSNT